MKSENKQKEADVSPFSKTYTKLNVTSTPLCFFKIKENKKMVTKTR